jgi:hypothetical protein
MFVAFAFSSSGKGDNFSGNPVIIEGSGRVEYFPGGLGGESDKSG